MRKKMDLLDKMVEVTANSVTPEEFKETWGYSIDEHVGDMMDRIHKLEGKKAPTVELKEKKEPLKKVAITLAPAASGSGRGYSGSGWYGGFAARYGGGLFAAKRIAAQKKGLRHLEVRLKEMEAKGVDLTEALQRILQGQKDMRKQRRYVVFGRKETPRIGKEAVLALLAKRAEMMQRGDLVVELDLSKIDVSRLDLGRIGLTEADMKKLGSGMISTAGLISGAVRGASGGKGRGGKGPKKRGRKGGGLKF